MSTAELRNSIGEYLSDIEDVSFLNALQTIVASKASENLSELSDFQINRIQSGRRQHKEGQTVANDVLQQEINQWVNSKAN